MTPISIASEGRSWTAANPREVCRGECAGPLEYIPNLAGPDTWPASALPPTTDQSRKRLFVCDVASMALRPLLPDALGFVFGEGATLGHFCRILRHHRIPAVIDRYLWQQARDLIHTGKTGISVHLKCGQALIPTQEMLARHHAQLREYRQRLCTRSLVIPVYDLETGKIQADQAGVDPHLGEKALGVNALQAEGFPTAPALLLANPARRAARLEDDRSFAAVLKQIFPSFASRPAYGLIVRGSLHSEDGSHSGMSGLLTSPTVTSHGDLAHAIDEHVSRWKAARQEGLGLSIILQERIASPVFGILATACPWDYNQELSVAELTLGHGRAVPQAQIFLNDLETILQNGSLAEAVRPFAAQSPTVARTDFCEAFTRLVQDGLALRDRYALPLDIEFVETAELQHRFVQFRPLYRLDPPYPQET